jgi:large subunit ribosomal protein L16
MLMPKRTKYRRPHRVYFHGKAKGGTELAFGDYGIVATEGCWLTTNQLEAARVAITRKMNRQGQVWIKVFPHLSKTKKPLAVRMGSGKGSPEVWVAVVKQGVILFEVAGVPDEIAREALRLASHKLPCSTKIITKVGDEQ